MISESSDPKKRYRGLSHSKIIKKQNEELHDVLTSPTPSTTSEMGECGLSRSEIEKWKVQRTKEKKELAKGVDATAKTDGVRPEDTLYNFEEPLNLSKFVLAGLGEKGRDCGKVVMSDVDIGEDEDDIKAVKFKPLNCSRIECPTCYYEWAIRQTFEIALRVEAMAEIRGERPFHVIFSIHPDECSGMTWGDVNQRIWRRGVRRLRYKRCQIARKSKIHKVKDCPDCYTKKIRCNNAGKRGHHVDECPDCYNEKIRCEAHDHKVEDCPDCFDFEEYGGDGIFHPLRVKRKWKMEWSRGRKVNATHEDDLRSGKFWERIRTKIKEKNETLEKYTKIGFHCHNWVFTDNVEKQENKEYVIKFCQNFKRFKTKEVVALTRYLVTHTATIRETAIYHNNRCNNCGHSRKVNEYRCGHCGRTDEIEETHVIRNRIIHPIRDYGILNRFDPKKALIKKFGKEKGTKLYHELAHKIAELLFLRNDDGDLITMVWNEKTEELEYPAYPKQIGTSDEDRNWIAIWKLFDLCNETSFLWDLSNEKREFVEDLLDYLKTEGKPPPLEDCGRSLDDVLIVPDAVGIVVPIKKLEFPSSQEREYSLRKRIVELIRGGEDDVFKLDICLADADFGSILRSIDLLREDGTVIKQPDGELILGV